MVGCSAVWFSGRACVSGWSVWWASFWLSTRACECAFFLSLSELLLLLRVVRFEGMCWKVVEL